MHTRILIPTHRSDQVKVVAPPAPARNRGRGRAPPGQFPRRVPCRCLLLTRETGACPLWGGRLSPGQVKW
jgi:hypothetical protein